MYVYIYIYTYIYIYNVCVCMCTHDMHRGHVKCIDRRSINVTKTNINKSMNALKP